MRLIGRVLYTLVGPDKTYIYIVWISPILFPFPPLLHHTPNYLSTPSTTLLHSDLSTSPSPLPPLQYPSATMIPTTILWLAFAAFGLATPVSRDEAIAVSSELPATPPTTVLEFIDNASVGEDFVFANSAYIIDDIIEVPSNDSLKRETAQGLTYYTQVNVDRTGKWQDCWRTASSCVYGDHAPAGGSATISTSYSRSFSISFGLDAGLTSNVEGVINGNGGLNLGFQWTKQYTWSTAYGCNVNSDVHVGQIFAQAQMGWADTATRKCSTGSGGVQCGSWTFGHIDFPLKTNGQPALKGGCSQTYRYVHCDVPVGTPFC